MTDIKHPNPPPDDRNASPFPQDPEFASVLRSFVGANRKLLVWVPERPLDQFIAFRDGVLDAAQSEAVISETAAALTAAHADPQTAHAVHLIVLELRAFSSAVDVATAPSAPPAAAEGPRVPMWKRLLRVGGTATDSLREILERFLGERGKAIWKLLSEVAEIFGGD